jgi:F-type H+-transporting ATPase subunit c
METAAVDLVPIAKAIIVAVGVLGPALGVGMIFSKGLEGIARNPEASGKIMPYMFAGAGMAEALGLLALVWFFLI